MSEEGVEIEVDESSKLYVVVGYGLVLVGIIAAAAYYFFFQKKEKKRGADVDVDEALATNTVGLADITYIASKLTPESDPLDVLLAVASTPESIAWSTKSLAAREKLIAKRVEANKEEAAKKKVELKKSNDDKMFEFDDDGWADDEEEDEETKKKEQLSNKIMEEKQKLGKEVAKASGKVKIPIEGMDDGVIGQEWVEKTLGRTGAWPPKDLRFLKDMTFDYKGKKVAAIDHPGLRRNLCFVAGRLNSLALNAHPELLQAASKQLVDPTYFKSAADFRQRCAMLLEATLRSAVSLRSFPLTKTIVEAVSIFKIGCRDCKQKEIDWFDSIMKKQYAVLPRLKIENTSIECAKYPEMATEDVLLISLDLTRLHAENFTRQKVAMCQKQGIPPQVALQQYREGWWYFVTGERVDGETPASCAAIKKEGTLLEKVNKEDLARFEDSKFEERLLTAWPMIVANVAQKSGKVKIQFNAPSVAGKYKFHVTVKSQDFLGADQVFSVEADIVDKSTVDRQPLVEAETKGDDKEDEGKKDK
mmetsp:Transcript_661/g.1568  ORF Transcript_661/g.1568 Transcript_661/m.1568 type:complete len:532 (-) Transcript_661:48-1643(-)